MKVLGFADVAGTDRAVHCPHRGFTSYRKHYEANKGDINIERTIKRRIFYEWWIEYKKTLKCERCDESFWYCLDFHHKDSSNKEGMISKFLNLGNKDKVINETKKCIVLCSNCHRKEHHDWTVEGRGNSFLVSDRYKNQAAGG